MATIARDPVPVLIGLGSNASPEVNLREAAKRLSVGKMMAASTVYESQDLRHGGNNYLNAVVRVDSSLPAIEIQQMLKKIEKEMGRTAESKRIGRVPIDLDLCLVGDEVIDENDLHIPHRDLSLREYLAKACAEVLPKGIHPVTGESLRDLAGRLSNTMKLIVRADVVLLPSDKGLSV
jgi:2-amino-4-hydroxy-6-hydroxymethyldihydropteridine diphosphokinase